MSSTTAHAGAASDELSTLRAELANIQRPSAGTVERAYRIIARNAAQAELRVAWLGNHTLDPVVRETTVRAFVHGVTVANVIGPFGQHFQSVLHETSEVLTFKPDVIVLWLSVRAVAPALVEAGLGLADEERRAEVDRVIHHVEEWVSLAKQRTRASLLLCNFPRPPSPRLGLGDPRAPAGEAALFADLNSRLSALYRSDPRVFVLDAAHAVAEAGSRGGWNPRLFRLAKIEWDGDAAAAISNLVGRALRALVRPPRKCLVVDLDNTLWGGVVGEDGVGGIRVAEGDPVGEAFRAFQRVLLDLKARGTLLALCSKNNEEDVVEVFRSVDMPLRLTDFAAKRINWNRKHENLVELARELNIGVDSLVFVDDSFAECELVRQMLPEVKTLQLPADPADYADILLDLPDFDQLSITAEDRRKTEQYAENEARVALRERFTDLSSYLESLGTRLQIAAVGAENLVRVHQLFGKTNQFNCTTKRYSLTEVEKFSGSPDWLFECVRAKDNFGDLGIIGVYLVRLDSEEPEIDSVILSCRAMGRGIETAMCNRIKRAVFDERQAAALRGLFVSTDKNKPAADFYQLQGFDVHERTEDGAAIYRVTRAASVLVACPGITVAEGI